MRSTIQTRSSQQKLKQTVNSHTNKKKSCKENQSTSPISTSSKGKNTSTKKKRTVPKKNPPVLSDEIGRETKIQLQNTPVVVIKALPNDVFSKKLKVAKERTKAKSRVIQQKNKQNSAKVKKGKSSVNGKVEKPSLEEDKVNKIKSPVLRTQRGASENKRPMNAKSVSKSTKNCKVELRPKYNESKVVALSTSSKKLPEEEHTVKNRRGILKKPLINDMRTHSESPSPAKLRSKRMVNYAESSLESTINLKEKLSDEDKVPVYNQPVVENKKNKRKRDDLYEFDESDNENIKRKKKQKDVNSSSEEYDRTIRNILKNVVNKVRKRNQKKIYADSKNNVKSKPSTKKMKFEKNHMRTVIRNKDHVEINMKIPESTLDEQGHQQPNQLFSPPPENHQVSRNIESDECFGFNTNQIETDKRTSKIKLISNIQLQSEKELNWNMASPSKFRDSKPRANSTMLNIFSPWRFNDVNVRRNPHFLAIKETSLPCISQEMVLDHSVVDKFEDATKTPQRKTTEISLQKKTPKQKYVTDYFGNGEESENKENTNISLFDYEQLSPIKSNIPVNNNVETVKRKILCENDDNIKISSSTPKRDMTSVSHQPNSARSKDDHPNFGFNSDDEENYEATTKKNKDDKPFRVSVNMNVRKYTRQKVKRPKSPPIQATLPSDEEEDDEENDLSDVECHEGEIMLFEDFNDTDDYSKKTKLTKKKTKWLNDDNQKYKRRKDVRTKEEEEEAEKWAAAFNSMCDEIEEFPLEIE